MGFNKAKCVRVGPSSIHLQNVAFTTIRRGKSKEDGKDIHLLIIHFTQGVKLELEADTQAKIEHLRDWIECATNGLVSGWNNEHIYVPLKETPDVETP